MKSVIMGARMEMCVTLPMDDHVATVVIYVKQKRFPVLSVEMESPMGMRSVMMETQTIMILVAIAVSLSCQYVEMD